MRKCGDNFPIPVELTGEDVYDMLFIFDDEREAVEYVVNTYGTDKEKLIAELYEDEGMRQEYGKENYLRGASVKGPETIISELMSGEYILWIAY